MRFIIAEHLGQVVDMESKSFGERESLFIATILE